MKIPTVKKIDPKWGAAEARYTQLSVLFDLELVESCSENCCNTESPIKSVLTFNVTIVAESSMPRSYNPGSESQCYVHTICGTISPTAPRNPDLSQL